MKALTLILGLALLVGKACGDNAPTPTTDTETTVTTDTTEVDNGTYKTPTVELARNFELYLGGSVSNAESEITIQFLNVVEDSRCPTNTNCVWEGQAKMSFLVNGDPVELTLRDGKPNLAKQLLADGEHVVSAKVLTPYPDGSRIDRDSYHVELLITKMVP